MRVHKKINLSLFLFFGSVFSLNAQNCGPQSCAPQDCVSQDGASQDCASRGSITEALFILQNKHRELAERIQKLKKKLTDCFAQQKKILDTNSSVAKPRIRAMKGQSNKALELNLCTLYQKLFPIYIKELEQLASHALDAISQFSQEEPIQAATLKKEVDRAFLVQKKIKIETMLINHISHLDENEWKLKHSKNVPASRIQILKKDSAFLKKALKKHSQVLAKINDQLYKEKGSRPTRTFLDDLARYVS